MGKSWLQYSEETGDGYAPASPKRVALKYAYLDVLHTEQSSISLKPSTVKSLMGLIFDTCTETWKMSSKHGAARVTTMSTRRTNLCRVVAQGEIKRRGQKKGPRLVGALPWNAREERLDGDDLDEA